MDRTECVAPGKAWPQGTGAAASALHALENHEIPEPAGEKLPERFRQKEPSADSQVVRRELMRYANVSQAGEEIAQSSLGIEMRSRRLEVLRRNLVDRTERSSPDEPVNDSALEREKRTTVVDHAADLPPAAADTCDLSGRRRRVRTVVNDSPGIDEVERAIGERKGLGVGLFVSAGEVRQLEAPPREQDASFGQVHSCETRAGRRESLRVRACPDTDLQHVSIFPLVKARVLLDKRFASVSDAGDPLEVLARTFREWITIRAAWAAFPVLSDPLGLAQRIRV